MRVIELIELLNQVPPECDFCVCGGELGFLWYDVSIAASTTLIGMSTRTSCRMLPSYSPPTDGRGPPMLEKAIEKRITAYVERELGGRCLKLGDRVCRVPRPNRSSARWSRGLS